MLGDRSELTTREKKCRSRNAELRRQHRKPLLLSHRRPLDLLWLAVLTGRVQQARSRVPPSSSGIPLGGLVWCFLSAVYPVNRADNGDVARRQLFSHLHPVLSYFFLLKSPSCPSRLVCIVRQSITSLVTSSIDTRVEQLSQYISYVNRIICREGTVSMEPPAKWTMYTTAPTPLQQCSHIE
jgi:hypothetical protein